MKCLYCGSESGYVSIGNYIKTYNSKGEEMSLELDNNPPKNLICTTCKCRIPLSIIKGQEPPKEFKDKITDIKNNYDSLAKIEIDTISDIE